MAPENIEVVGRLIDAWNQRDLEAALEEMHPQCEVRPVEATETLRGHDGVAAAFRDCKVFRFEEYSEESEARKALG